MEFLSLKVCNLRCVESKYNVQNCVYPHIHAVKTQQISQIVSLYSKQHYVIYNHMFRPCKRAIIRLFTEPSNRLHNRSLGGTRSRLTGEISSPPNSFYVYLSVCCVCCVLSGRGLCDELITRLEESYRLYCVVVCDLETSRMRRSWPTGDCRAKKWTAPSVNHSSLWTISWNLLSYMFRLIHKRAITRQSDTKGKNYTC